MTLHLPNDRPAIQQFQLFQNQITGRRSRASPSEALPPPQFRLFQTMDLGTTIVVRQPQIRKLVSKFHFPTHRLMLPYTAHAIRNKLHQTVQPGTTELGFDLSGYVPSCRLFLSIPHNPTSTIALRLPKPSSVPRTRQPVPTSPSSKGLALVLSTRSSTPFRVLIPNAIHRQGTDQRSEKALINTLIRLVQTWTLPL